MIEQLKHILSTQGKEISDLLNILSRQEQIKLYGYFDSELEQTHDTNDITIKFLALNSLFIYIKNNPSVEKELQDNDIETEKLALKIYELANILYSLKPTLHHYYYMVSYAVLADKATLLSTNTSHATSEEFSDKVLQFFIQFVFPPRIPEDLEKRKKNLDYLKNQFSKIQKAENISSKQQIFEIVALSNLVSLGEKLQMYLLEGTGVNMVANINNEVANALKVFADTGSREWELICSLLRFVLHKLYENSIWTHANRLPFFKQFVEKQLEQGSFLFSLFASQKAALQGILSASKSTVISMPTSSGKTLLAEIKILYTRSLYPDGSLCAYVVPTNALVNQTLKRFRTSLPDLKIKQLLPYNHFDSLEKDLIGEQPDILISTPEKLNFLLKNQESKILYNLRLIVIDEAHNISDQSRGSIWEFLLANLKQNDEKLSYLLLTPFIKNKEELAGWLGGESSLSKSIEWTPTKQYVAYHSLHSDKTKSKSKSKINYLPSARNSIIKEAISIDLSISPQNKKKELQQKSINDVVRNAILVEKYAQQLGCILILHKGVGSAEKLAEELAKKFNFSVNSHTYQLSYAKEVIRQELGENHSLLTLLNKGVAFHHSQLSPLVKEVIENLVSDDAIKLLVATTTLAQGMNFPIKTVIFETLNLGGGGKSLPHSDFWNIAGRAGRAYKDTEGHIVLGWKDSNVETKKNLESFIVQDIEKTISSLKAFVDAIEGDQTIDYQFIKDKPIAQNFLHYLNHLMNINYEYKLDKVTRQDITNILANSLYFKQNEFTEGFLETQEKVVNFSNQYIDSIRNKETSQLKLADTLGITDISLSTIIGRMQEHKHLLSKCIAQNDKDNLAKIIDAINSIPELKISLGRQKGQFQPELVASILLKWINGESIWSISHKNDLSTNECSGYIFSRLKNYIPWGMAIYQNISNDKNDLLPSYAFYGVKDKESVKLSYIGVPRFALNKVKQAVADKKLYEDTSQLSKFIKEQHFSLEDNQVKNDIVNEIIKKSIV